MAVAVPSVVNAFTIMRSLGGGRALTLSEVAQSCGISPSSCLGLLRTLVGEGVLHLGAGKRYSLTAQWAASVSDDVDHSARLIASARPLLDRAARDWQTPVGLWQLVSNERLQLVALGEDNSATRIHMEEGQRQPIGGGSIGRALAAYQRVEAAELERRHGAVRWQRTVPLADYLAEIEEARARGWSIDDGATYAGITSLAVALPREATVFCLSVSVFAGSRTEDELRALGIGLTELSAKLINLI